jgi:hypothetical protein
MGSSVGYDSTLSKDDKNINFLYIKNILGTVDTLYQFINSFIQINQGHNSVEKYALQILVDNKAIKIGTIDNFNPQNKDM